MSLNNERRWGVSNLRLAFPQKKQMLFKDLSFHYEDGEKILLLGPSGSGKSTLLQVLSGLVPNSIELPMKAEHVRIPENWGFIFQDPDTQFCMPYADEEIAFVLENRRIPRERMPERIQHYLKMVGLNLSDPHQLIRTFSGGMKQRLAVASILALEPDVLFLDEPTALLDPKGTDQLWETVRRIAENRTLLIVEHKIERVLDLIDRVVLFDYEGRIIADGPKHQILSTHRKELDAYGIWYPGVWKGYEEENPGSKAENPFSKAVLDLDDIRIYRGKEVKFAVNQLTLYQGEWVAVVGKNGAGKSTLAEGIMGLIRRTGTINWHLECPEEDVAFVFQNPEYQFVTDRVDDELAFSLRLKQGESEEEIRRKVNQALEQFRLTEQRDQHPFQLSVGQKRRLSVASVLIDQPKAVILDEPTFGQDARNTFALLDLFQKLRESGTTIIMITHEKEIVRHFATRILTIKEGRIVSDSREAKPKEHKEGADGKPADEHGQVVF